MSSNYLSGYDPISQDAVDLDSQYITDSWLVDRFVGNTVWGWGGNYRAQMPGAGGASPIQIGTANNWSRVACGYGKAEYIDNSGNASGLGYNQHNELISGAGVKQISCGYTSTSFIKTDGSLYMAGTILGGNQVATRVGTLNTWSQVSCGLGTALIIKTDGTLWGCGYNGNGQLGTGNSASNTSPVQVGSLTNWKQVSSGYSNTAAVKTDGTLWVWGTGTNGALGLGDTKNYYSPVQVGSLTNWKSVSVGYYNIAAIQTNGTLWTCGVNDQGQLGTGDVVSYSTFVQVGTLSNWKQVSAGEGAYITKHMMAIKSDGTLWGWGANGQGRLGDGTTVSKSSPVQIGSLTNWKYVTCGYNSTLAIQNQNI